MASMLQDTTRRNAYGKGGFPVPVPNHLNQTHKQEETRKPYISLAVVSLDILAVDRQAW